MTTTFKFSNKDKSEVLKTAWELIHKTGTQFGEALRRAYVAIKVKIQLATASAEGITFRFAKVSDGSIREARGTRNLALIPADKQPKASGNVSGLTVPYFDLDAQDWRCFRVDSLLA